jgi:predicted transcriptional regulator
MLNVNFHDNTAIETGYGFNIDSLQNSKIVIAFNLIVRPQLYGIVIGGSGDFSDFSIHDNTVKVGPKTVNGLVFQGNVRGAHVLRNKIIAERPTGASNVVGFLEKNSKNVNNVFQENVVTGSFKNSLQGSDCLWGNVNETGREMDNLRKTQDTRCQADQ